MTGDDVLIKLKDIYGSVCRYLTELTEIPTTDSDLEEPIKRPCFRVFMDTVKTGFYSSALRQVRVYFEIYYYATDRGHSKAEIMDMKDTLSMSFMKPFYIKEHCAVYIDDVEFEKLSDGIMNCSFSFEIATEFLDESDIETMETLYLNKKLEV